MTEEENKGVDQAVAAPSETDSVQKEVSAEAVKPIESDEAINWKKANQELRELKKQNRALYEAMLQQQQQLKPQTPEVDELDRLSDDDVLTKAQAAKLAEKRARKIVEETLQEHERNRWKEKALYQYADFDSVVTPENIELFEKTMPSLAKAIESNADPYRIAVATYEAIKSMGINQKKPAMQQSLQTQSQIEKNLSKPLSSNAAGKAALQDAFASSKRWSKEQLNQAWQETQQYSRRA